MEFLSDLELRLGIVSVDVPGILRAQVWATRMDALGSGTFFARSFDVDRLGTARAVLALRDALRDAGWNGEGLASGGERIETLRQLEAIPSPEMPLGAADRLRGVESALAQSRASPYDEVRLCESEDLWAGRWRGVFARLRECGAVVITEPSLAWMRDGGGREDDTDLGRLKRFLLFPERPDEHAHGPLPPAGDGSLMIVRADTSIEAAEGVAALARTWSHVDMALIRSGEHALLDGALSRQHLPTLGSTQLSPWRSLLGVLPLALELMFEPRDPLRLIELLTLPDGPFRGEVGGSLARAVAAEPGVGGRRWCREIASLRELSMRPAGDARADAEPDEHTARSERIRRRLTRVAEWLDGPLCDPLVGAPRSAVVDTIGRVRSWAAGRLKGRSCSDPELTSLLRQLETLALAVVSDSRQLFSRDVLRDLVATVRGSGDAHQLWPEEAGRVEHVRGPSGLRRRFGTVVWWHFVEGSGERSPGLIWRRSELAALSAAGFEVVDPMWIQEARARSWHRAALAAERRLVLVVPARAAGEPTVAHPLMDQVASALNVDERGLAKLTVSMDELLSGPVLRGVTSAPSDRVEPLMLPAATPCWHVDPAALQPAGLSMSVEALEAMLGCPLRWALQYRAGLRRSSVAEVPPVQRLAGVLGHRLVEELHRSALAANRGFDATGAPALLDALIATEGAILLRPGMSFERAQLKRDLLRAMDRLARFLAASGYRIVDVERDAMASWDGVQLSGRLDLLLVRSGEELVLDLKWGHATYRDSLASGRALQLAAYAFMRAQAADDEWPATAYYSLSRGVVLTADDRLAPTTPVIPGKKSREVWKAASSSLHSVRSLLDTGRLPVTGLACSRPLHGDAGVQDPVDHLVIPPEDACKYCACHPICGKAWERFSDGDGGAAA